jgi:hypothetical protein
MQVCSVRSFSLYFILDALLQRLFGKHTMHLKYGSFHTAGNKCDNTDKCYPNEFTIEWFYPPYFYSTIPKPVISEAPARIGYGAAFDVVVKLRPGLVRPALRAAIVNPGYGRVYAFSFVFTRVLRSCILRLLNFELLFFILSSSSIFLSKRPYGSSTADSGPRDFRSSCCSAKVFILAGMK